MSHVVRCLECSLYCPSTTKGLRKETLMTTQRKDERLTYISEQIIRLIGIAILYCVPEPVRLDDVCPVISHLRLCLDNVFIDDL